MGRLRPEMRRTHSGTDCRSPVAPLVEQPKRFDQKILSRCEPTPSGCMGWTGVVQACGYGSIGSIEVSSCATRTVAVSLCRFTGCWIRVNGPVPKGLLVTVSVTASQIRAGAGSPLSQLRALVVNPRLEWLAGVGPAVLGGLGAAGGTGDGQGELKAGSAGQRGLVPGTESPEDVDGLCTASMGVSAEQRGHILGCIRIHPGIVPIGAEESYRTLLM